MSKSIKQIDKKIKRLQAKRRVLELEAELEELKFQHAQALDSNRENYGIYIDRGLAEGIEFSGNRIIGALNRVGNITRGSV